VVVKVQYFAQLRDLGGPESVELDSGSTVGILLKKLFEQSPGLAVWNKNLLLAAGTEWVRRDYVICPGEVISLMPPVQGG
jgi:molybdopterin converting factor small subunit